MLSGRHARNHSDGDAAANEPVFALRGPHPVALIQSLLHQIQALIQAIAPVFQILGFILKRNERIRRTYDIAPAELDWIYLQSAGNLVYRRLNSEDGLRQ